MSGIIGTHGQLPNPLSRIGNIPDIPIRLQRATLSQDFRVLSGTRRRLDFSQLNDGV